jgi:hypothetical protein
VQLLLIQSLVGLVTIFYSLIRESSALLCIPSRDRVGQLSPQALCSIFVASYDSQIYGGHILFRLHMRPRQLFLFIYPQHGPQRIQQQQLFCFRAMILSLREMFIAPSSSNEGFLQAFLNKGCLCWFPNSGFMQTCRIMKFYFHLEISGLTNSIRGLQIRSNLRRACRSTQ